MKTPTTIFLSLLLTFVAAPAAMAQMPGAFQVMPFSFVPEGSACDAAAFWTLDTSPFARSGGNPNGTLGTSTRSGSGNSVLLLRTECPGAGTAMAGATLSTSLVGWRARNLTELGFDLLSGSCSANTPRFNVMAGGTTYSLGCASGMATTSSAVTRVVFDPAILRAAGIPPMRAIQDISIVFDGPGQALLDNIDVNGTAVGDRPLARTQADCKQSGYRAFGFRNQGQCVSYVVSRGLSSAWVPFWRGVGLRAENTSFTAFTPNTGIGSSTAPSSSFSFNFNQSMQYGATSTGTRTGTGEGVATPAVPAPSAGARTSTTYHGNPNGSFSASGYSPPPTGRTY